MQQSLPPCHQSSPALSNGLTLRDLHLYQLYLVDASTNRYVIMDIMSSDDEESSNDSDNDNIFVLKQATMKRPELQICFIRIIQQHMQRKHLLTI